jgi:hypothetical protein
MLSAYSSGLLIFHTWWDSKKLAKEEHAPTSQDTITAFITDLVGAYARYTIANYIQGVRVWHRIYNIPLSLEYR